MKCDKTAKEIYTMGGGRDRLFSMRRKRFGKMTAGALLVTAMMWKGAAYGAEAGKAGPPMQPGLPFLAASTQAMDAALCRTQALQAEAADNLPAALTAWERVIDRCPSTEEQTGEARAHIHKLRPKVLRNTDPTKAHSWKVLVIIFRQLDFSWQGKDLKQVYVHKTISAENEQKIRGSIEAYGRHVFSLSSGMLRLDTEFQVVEAPVTNLAGQAQGPFSPAPHVLYPLIKPLLKDRQYDTVFGYVKYNDDKGPSVPAPFTAATYASISEVNGAGFVMVPWHTNYPYPGETDGEMELHEWLHQIDWMFTHVLKYPDQRVPSSDEGRMEGDNRPGGDPDYFRKKEVTTWMGLYQHIMEDHITRQMWFEARMYPEKEEEK